MLRKVEEGNEVVELEALWLAKEREVMEAGKKKAKKEAEQLRQELQELQMGFAVQNEELKAEYQK